MKTLIKLLLLPFSIVFGLFSLVFVTIQHTFFRSNHRYKGETGVLQFAKADPSFFRKWFNDHHKAPQQDSKEIRLNSVFEFIIYTSAEFNSLTSTSELLAGVQGTYVPKEIKKHRNEIATFEIACFLLSYFKNWAKTNNYPDSNEAYELFFTKLSTLTSECFELDKATVSQMIKKRVPYYSLTMKDDLENAAFSLTSFILWGFNNKTPGTEGFPSEEETNRTEDFNEMPENLEKHLKKITSSLKQQWNGWLMNTEKAG